MFTEEDGTTITNEDKKISNKKNSAFLKLQLRHLGLEIFLTFLRLWGS